MNFQYANINNITVITVVSDKFTNIIASEFRDLITKYVDEGNLNFILDLTHVEYMDSAGLGSVITANNILADNIKKTGEKGKIVICNVEDRVKSIFSIFHMNLVLSIYNTREEALKSFGE